MSIIIVRQIRRSGIQLTAIIPKILLAVAVSEFPVPLSLVGKISGVYA